jgi:hypothetical protein
MIRTKARACEGKISHASRAAALAHKSRLIAEGASPVVLNVYACPTVKPGQVRHFHVGHRIPARRK